MHASNRIAVHFRHGARRHRAGRAGVGYAGTADTALHAYTTIGRSVATECYEARRWAPPQRRTVPGSGGRLRRLRINARGPDIPEIVNGSLTVIFSEYAGTSGLLRWCV